jgi:hypothetical protein
MTNLDRYKSDFEKLVKLGEKMELDVILRHRQKSEGKLDQKLKDSAEKLKGTFENEYQRWFTESSAVIRQLLPDRLGEFEHLYKGDSKRRIINSDNYNIQDWLNGIRSTGTVFGFPDSTFDDFGIAFMRFRTQLSILKAVGSRFDSSLFDIRQLVQADLFDSELEAARELVRHGFVRPAGALAGVVLEKHLAQVLVNHKLATQKKNPTISDFNDKLKSGAVVDVPTWRGIQRLGDLRNLCDHNKDREPTKEEVTELIDGIDKITKTLF